MSDTEAQEAYESESDYFEEDEEGIEEVEEEEAEEDKDDDIIEIEEAEAIVKPVLQKLNDPDRNHRVIKVVPDSERRSSHILQFSEMVEAIGIRATQIESGSPIFVDHFGLDDPIKIAKMELLKKCSPLKLRRKMRVDANSIMIEKFDINEMTLPISEKEILDITKKEMSDIVSKNSNLKN